MRQNSLAAACTAAALIVLTGCSYPVTPSATPIAGLSIPETSRLPGRFYVTVDAPPWVMQRDVKPVTWACSANTFPVDASAAFRESVTATLRQSVQSIELVDRQSTLTQLQANDASGHIMVRAADFRLRVGCFERGFGAGCVGKADLAAEVVVTGLSGKLVEEAVKSSASVDPGDWGMCDIGGTALAAATEAAMRDLMPGIIRAVTAARGAK